ncbi:MAG: 3-phosphoshikimate 1-carboxyvinyltransferase [Ruminococcus sp.]|jgi:3-phosphoshikimate 1-carboxyvinyltransferase|nr:3-phosphoshikimate 1-carboxyvinyltransferase [Ruminococcus sp.]
MNVTINPKKLIGSVDAPPSKSYAHRALIAAALCFSQSIKINNVALSEDIEATMSCLESMGAHFTLGKQSGGRFGIVVNGIDRIPESAHLECNESGSTLRFIIPICAALGVKSVFTGRGKLPLRPLDTYLREMGKNGIDFKKPGDRYLPLKMSGRLRGGIFETEGNISSQFISGLMFALPLCSDDSHIVIEGELQSAGYAEMTAGTLRKFGVTVDRDEQMNCFVRGGQKYFNLKKSCLVENDWSQAAFFHTANFLGSELGIKITKNSVQPDSVIVDILKKIEEGSAFEFSMAQCPDILPILTVAASFSQKPVTFTNAERLVIKESNRLKTASDMINALGGRAEYSGDSLKVFPVESFTGGTVDGAGDHRIVMSAAIAATRANSPVTIIGAEAVRKSFPDFWEVYESIGGEFSVFSIEE